MKSIDSDFKKFFPNANSILDYTYYYYQGSPDYLDNLTKEEDVAVSNFPMIVDRWLAHRNDLHEFIKRELEWQYLRNYSKGFSNSNIFTEPIYKEIGEVSHNYRIINWYSFKGRKLTKPYTYWSAEPYDYQRYYWELNRFVPDEYVTPDLLGLDFHWGDSTKKI